MNTTVTRNDWVGRVIDGRFPLLEWLGGTGQAGVFRTELNGPQPQRAAIKLMPADAENTRSLIEIWAAAAKISHPHLMRIFDSGRAQVGSVDLLYVVTEYAEESLAQVIPERPLTPGEAREMLDPVLDALSHLHGKGLVYGHLKPSNIMVVENRLKLPVDSLYRAGASKPRSHLKIYDAPETANGTISPAADIWSLGITLIEALTQHPPLWDRSTNRDPVVPAEVSQPFAGVARGCLRYEFSKRSTIHDIKAAVDPAISRLEPANEVDELLPLNIAEPADERRKAPPSKSRLTAIVAAALIVLALVVFLVMRSHRPQPSSPPVAQSPAPAIAPIPIPAPAPLPPPPRSSGVSAKGAVAERAMPDVLSSASRTIHGKVDVKVRVNVDAHGSVSNATFDSHGSSRYFANKALEAARKWRFKPAQVNGEPAPSVWTLKFEFRRNGTEVVPVEVSP